MQHLTSQQLKDYGRGALAPLSLLAADDHLGECMECHRRVAPVAVTSGAFRSLQEAFLLTPEGPTRHLEYAQLVALLDDTLENVEREIISGHLEGCGSCKNELRELSAFRVELAEPYAPTVIIPPDPLPAPAITPENLAQVGYDTKPRSWLRRMKNKLTSATDWTWVEAGVLSLLVLSLVFGLVWYARRAETSRRFSVGDNTLNSSMPYSPPPIVTVPVDSAAALPGASPGSGSSPYPTAPGNVYAPPPLPPQQDSAAVAPTYQSSATDAPMVSQLTDAGGSVALDRQGQLSGAEGLSAELQQAMRNALARQTVEINPPAPELAGNAGTQLRGKAEGVPFGLLGPLKSVSRTDRPTFHWQPMNGATAYVVTVFDQNFSAVAVSGKLNVTNWQPNSALPRGNVYMWQVAALKDGQEIISPTAPAPEAKFKVLEAEYLRDIEQAGKSGSRLAAGLAYARAGMLREAQQEFGALLRANPESPVARKLLQTVQKAAG